MNKYSLIPSGLQYSSAPEVDQEISISLEEQQELLTEYDRSATISLAQVYDDERQESTIFRPTFKVNYLYDNTFTGTTDYLPFQYNLYYIDAPESKLSGIWKGFPQYYEFDFFRPKLEDGHFNYRSKSAYTYNWSYYITYCKENNENQPMFYSDIQNGNINWVAKDGIPFSIINSTYNGARTILFNCIAPHGLSFGEWVELSFDYLGKRRFQVDLLGNGTFGSDKYIFGFYNVGFKGNVFINGKVGTFKRIINVANELETKSRYYVRQHMVLANTNDMIVSKNGFEKNIFRNQQQYEFSSMTPNDVSRISIKTNSDSYNFTMARDIDISGLLDNQKRPITELFLTIINKGYSGYFNFPNQNVGLKRGWKFNVSSSPNPWWDYNEINSNTNIEVDSYVNTNGVTKTFFYNKDLKVGDIIDGDFCEWNEYEQYERIISTCYHKIKFNQNVFQTVDTTNQNNNEYDTNSPGYYYQPHHKMNIRAFSDSIETAPKNSVAFIPSYAFYSSTDGEFRWRDLYTYGFIDSFGRGVDYPYLNSAHYPFGNVIFRLIPEGSNFTQTTINFVTKPLIDDCE